MPDSPSRSAPAPQHRRAVGQRAHPARRLDRAALTHRIAHDADVLDGRPACGVVPRRGLHEVRAAVDRREAHVAQHRRRPQRGLDDDLQHHVGCCPAHRCHLMGDVRQVTLGDRAERDHHVDLGRAVGDRRCRLDRLHRRGGPTVGKPDHCAHHQSVATHLVHERHVIGLHAQRRATRLDREDRSLFDVVPGGLGTQDRVVDPGGEIGCRGRCLGHRSTVPGWRATMVRVGVWGEHGSTICVGAAHGGAMSEAVGARTTSGSSARPQRSIYLDALRAVALCRVVIYHAVSLEWVTLFTAMPLMFFIAGSLYAASLERRPGAPGDPRPVPADPAAVLALHRGHDRAVGARWARWESSSRGTGSACCSPSCR